MPVLPLLEGIVGVVFLLLAIRWTGWRYSDTGRGFRFLWGTASGYAALACFIHAAVQLANGGAPH